MSKTIYKYKLQVQDEQELQLHEGAQILTVDMQGQHPCLWALVDTEAPIMVVKILIRGTGHSVDGMGKYISTFQVGGGALIFHAFEAP